MTAAPSRTGAAAGAGVRAAARRWHSERVGRDRTSAVACERIRVPRWDARAQRRRLAALADAFLRSRLAESAQALVAELLRQWGQRTGTRDQVVAAPLDRLRSAISRRWPTAPPPGRHQPLLNSG